MDTVGSEWCESKVMTGELLTGEWRERLEWALNSRGMIHIKEGDKFCDLFCIQLGPCTSQG